VAEERKNNIAEEKYPVETPPIIVSREKEPRTENQITAAEKKQPSDLSNLTEMDSKNEWKAKLMESQSQMERNQTEIENRNSATKEHPVEIPRQELNQETYYEDVPEAKQNVYENQEFANVR